MSNTSCVTYLDNAVIAIANIVLIQSAPYIRPNITGNGSAKNTWETNPIGSGCIKVTDTVSAKLAAGQHCEHALMSIDASLSNIIFGSSRTIQPSAYYALIIIKE